jgi:tight adherence protein F
MIKTKYKINKSISDISSRTKQRGVFIVEFALLASAMAILILGTADVVIKQNMLGTLDRLSYSAVNLLKERNEFYLGEEEISIQDVEDVRKLLVTSLSDTIGGFDQAQFAISVEQQLVDDDNNSAEGDDININNGCNVNTTLSNLIQNIPGLAPITNSGRRARVYQVTLCYEATNFFGAGTTTISAFSLSLGR